MSRPPEADEVAERARALLGPASAERLSAPEGYVAVLAGLSRGKDMESALLAEAERIGREDAAVRDEFLGCIMGKMRHLGRGSLSPRLRRYLDTVDIMQSVAGDVLAEGRLPDFENLAGFLALLRQRLRWKAADHARRLDAGKRNERQREARPVEDITLAADGGDPVAASERAEFIAHVRQVMTELNERDQELLRLFLSGVDTQEIAGRLGLAQETAGRVLRRAKDRLRRRLR